MLYARVKRGGAAAMIALGLVAGDSFGGTNVAPDRVVSAVYGVSGALAAIDVPFAASTPTNGGPDWVELADEGFATANSPLQVTDGTSNWEPDGTPIGEAKGYFVFGGGVPSVTWTFSQAAAGIDLPDGSIIWGIYATWNTRGSDGITYQYAEGAQSGTILRQAGGAAPAADLVLSWVDAVGTTNSGSFERIFAEPVVVEGGDGFELWGTDNYGNAAHIDAVVIDYQGPPAEPIVVVKSPSDDATGVLLDANIWARFDENILLTGEGTVTLRNLTLVAGSDIVLSLPDSQVSVTNDTLTINPAVDLGLGTTYAVQISTNALKDADDTPFAGIADDTTWNFDTTSDDVPPMVTHLFPADDAIDVLPFLNLVAAFDENVQLTGTGTVTISNLTLGPASNITIHLPDNKVSIAGDRLTIDPGPDLDFETDYAVQISADAVVDFFNNGFAGIGNDTNWNFTTAGTLGGVEVTPDHVVTGTVQGTLLVIDPPRTIDDDGNVTGIGYAGVLGNDHRSYGWEPDGTDDNTQWVTGWKNGGSVTYTFDLPDGAEIHAILHDWKGQGNQSASATYSYDEGTLTTAVKSHKVHPVNDLVLRWTAADNDAHDVNFEQLFTGPITVAGEDGFTITVSNGLIALGAMLVDFDIPPVPTGVVLVVR